MHHVIPFAHATTTWTPDATRAVITPVYYEGLPFEVAQKLPPAATAHLSAILEDPDLRPHHPNALLALGISGHPGSYEIISEYPLPREGELSRPAYHALVAQRSQGSKLPRPGFLDCFSEPPRTVQYPRSDPRSDPR